MNQELQRRTRWKVSALLAAVLGPLLLGALLLAWPEASAAQVGIVRFAVIGDYGRAGPDEAAVANMIKGWNPDFVITTGDNNYPNGEASTIDANIGQYYHEFIHPYRGTYGAGALVNRFFPSLGNHDWYTVGAAPYLDYFTLPGNERYYDFVSGPVHLFAVDSDQHEPDGTSSGSLQGEWLRNGLAASTACWRLVYFHHAPYSSGSHGGYLRMQWPFAAWGAHAVLAGHDHTYERIERDGIPYFVNGLGGASRYAFVDPPVEGSVVRYNADFGAMLVTADPGTITYEFFAIDGTRVDSRTALGGCLGASVTTPTATPSSSATSTAPAPTATPTPTPTPAAPTATPTPSAAPVPSSTSTHTATAVATTTPSPTGTATIPPTSTATPTSIPPTATSTRTPSPTLIATPTSSPTVVPTRTPASPPTATPTPTNAAPSPSPSATTLPSVPPSPTASPSPTAPPSPTATASPTPSARPPATATATPSVVPPSPPSPTPSATAPSQQGTGGSVVITLTPTASATGTATATATAVPQSGKVVESSFRLYLPAVLRRSGGW